MEVCFVLDKGLCQDFVILSEGCLGDNLLDVFILEAFRTLHTFDACIAIIDVYNDVIVETFLTDVRIVVVATAVRDGEDVRRSVFQADHTSVNAVRSGVGCGHGGLVLHCCVHKVEKPSTRLHVVSVLSFCGGNDSHV